MLNAAKEFLKRAFHHDGVRRYGANTLWLMAEKIIRLVVGFSIGIYVARSLGPAQYGLLNYSLGVVAILSVVIGLGTDDIFFREMVRHEKCSGVYLGTCLLVRAIGFFFMMCCVVVGVIRWEEGTEEGILILIIASGCAFHLFHGVDLYFQANVLSRYVVSSQIFALLCCSVARLYGAWKELPLVFFAWVEAGTLAICSAGYLFFYFRKGDVQRWRISLSILTAVLRDAWPLALSSLFVVVQMQGDLIMLKNMRSATDAGIYSVSVRWVALWYFVPAALGSSLFPAIVFSRGKSLRLYYFRLKQFFTLMLWCGIAFSLFSMLLSFLIIPFYGGSYSEAGFLMRLYSVGLVFVFLGAARSRWLTAENRNKNLLFCTGSGTLSNIALNYYMIPRWGAAGCCIASVTSFFLSFVLVPLFLTRRRINLALLIGAIAMPFIYLKIGLRKGE